MRTSRIIAGAGQNTSKSIGFWLLAWTFILATACGQGQSGSEVVVVYNTQFSESQSVAEYYARKREVPRNQVIGLPLSLNEDISRTEFRETLQIPLARAFETKKLWKIKSVKDPEHEGRERKQVVESQVRYLLLCYGVPYRVQPDPALQEPGTDSWRPEMRRNEACVDSELALLPLNKQQIVLAGPLRNALFGATNAASLHPTNGVLMVTRLDGPSPEIARGLVDKALLAERPGLYGRAYVDIRNTTDPKYIAGDESMKKAAEICRRLGYETVVDTNGGTFPETFPMSHIAFYAGWYDETVSGPFTRPHVEFMPGAFAYHLHSFSAANLRSTNRSWVGPLLAKGVTATMGTVYEPYLGGTPDIATFTVKFLLEGATFGEAAMASQGVLSWQIIAVGDPLYRALPRNPDLTHAQFVTSKSRLQEWSWLRLVNANIAGGRPVVSLVLLLEEMEFRKSSPVLTEKLADLYAAIGKPSSAIEEYENALTMADSPNQRLRLRLTIADRLIAKGEDARAAEQLEGLLLEFSDYADRSTIYRRLARLARNQGQTARAEDYDSKAAAL